ncbi:hypothetical protein NIES4074_60750 (plasmid) [Cylindrospermum sp. NIES-4074]|nr:hypothetical protein NIES4074_60750 [Cylindrospermum sp. NIES-4074]
MYIFLQNDYCVIATDLLDSVKEVFQLSWEMIGDDSPTSTDREKIARYISNTPH